MSSKQAKKLLELRRQEEEAQRLAAEQQEEEEDDEESEQRIVPQKPAFAALLGDEDDESEEDEESSEKEEEVEKAPVKQQTTPRGKNKKKKVIEEQEEESEEEEWNEDDYAALEQAEKDNMANNMEVGGSSGSGAGAEDPAPDGSIESLLRVQKANFSTEAELKRVFGNAVSAAKSTAAGKKMKNTAMMNMSNPLHMRNIWLVPNITAGEVGPKKPDLSKCGTCEITAQGEGNHIFTVKKAPGTKAQQISRELSQVLATYDQHNMNAFLSHYPFHVDALLLATEAYKAQGQHEQALQLVKRALFVLEINFPNSFRPIENNPKLDADAKSVLGRALWLYMSGLGGQGLFQTALEVSKLLFRLTSEETNPDPCHMLPHICYYSLRSRRYEVLDALAGNENMHLPFVAYSHALAGFYATESPAALKTELTMTLAASAITTEWEKKGEGVCDRLAKALFLFPFQFEMILVKAEISLDSKPAGCAGPNTKTWRQLIEAAKAISPTTEANVRKQQSALGYAQCESAYAERFYMLWKADPVMKWAHDTFSRVVSMFEESKVFQDDWAKAHESFEEKILKPGFAYKSYADMSLAEFQDEGQHLILPPVLHDRLNKAIHQTMGHELGIGRIQFEGNVSVHSNPFIVFFQSLAPWSRLDRSGRAKVLTLDVVAQDVLKYYTWMSNEFKDCFCRKRKGS